MRFKGELMEIQSSALLLAEIARILKTGSGELAVTPHGTLYKAPEGGLGHKAVFVGQGATLEERKQRCLTVRTFLDTHGAPLRVWHELLDTHGAIIIDRLTVKQAELLQQESLDSSA